MEVRSTLKAGDQLGHRYRILKEIGRGGMGTVYLAEDLKLRGKYWAVKELGPLGRAQADFADEARFLATCSHPGLAAIVDYFGPADTGSAYLVMEYIQGDTLEQLLRRDGRYPWVRLVQYALQLCEVLEYLHEAGSQPIIYRDLKPSNIMVDGLGRIRLIDFGAARYYDRGAVRDTMLLGTPGFAAPEQLLGKQTDARTDLYALGAVMYYLLSGGQLYDRQSPNGGLLASVPDELQKLLQRLLEPQPNNRLQRAAQVKERLAKLLDGASGSCPVVVETTSLAGTGVNLVAGRQLIVVGSLTPGSGATFTTMSLARVLHRAAIPHVVIEAPGENRDLYHLLMGEQRMPKGYPYRSELVRDGSLLDGQMEWVDGYTEWVPVPASRPVWDWNGELTAKLLDSLKQPVQIVDLGTSWFDESAAVYWERAMAVLVVCGPSPVHLSRLSAAQVWLRLKQLDAGAGKLRLVANRDHRFEGKAEWLESLPASPRYILPEFPSSQILGCQWSGKLPADHPKLQPVLQAAFRELVSEISSHLDASGDRVKWRKPWWSMLNNL